MKGSNRHIHKKKSFVSWKLIIVSIVFLIILLSENLQVVPAHQLNICRLFQSYPDWYSAARETRKKWGVPISVQMAIIHEESHFDAIARPPHRRIFGFILWFRPTTAFGYAQAINQTWRIYLLNTHQKNASRYSFADSTDFIGWFVNRSHYLLGIPKNDAYDNYLAYHQGFDGYAHRNYFHDVSLKTIAHQVQHVAAIYRHQLVRCENQLNKQPWWRVW